MRVVTTIINDVFTDQRVKKQIEVLRSLGCRVTVVCRRQNDNAPEEEDGLMTVRLKFPVNKGPVFYFIYNLRLLIFLLFHRFDLYVANDLDTLLPCFLVSALRKKPLVYDAHEYFTGQYGLDRNKPAWKTWKRIERFVLPRIKNMITVSESIAGLYSNEYGVSPVVVRNVARSSACITPVARRDAGISEDAFLVVLQGAGLNPGRGSAELLEALSMTDNVHLLLIGSGDAMDEIHRKVSDRRLQHKVTFIPRVPWEKMMAYTKMCDAGLSLDSDISINQRYSLPNKLFDYISAGIPVITSSLPEIALIIRHYECGILIDNVTPDAVANALARLRDDEGLRQLLSAGALKASADLTWEREKMIEYEFFRTVMNHCDESRNDISK